MNKNLSFKIIIISIILAIVATILGINVVKADINTVIDTTRKASLTITKYEHSNGSDENKSLAGVEFTIYLVDDSISDVEEATEYIQNNDVTSYKKVTPENGTIKFSDLQVGRYLVVETDAPKNVVSKIESFLVDLPRTSDDGTNWNYDVTVYPKNITIYGAVTLHQKTQDNEPLEGVNWILQKLNNIKEWEKYDYENTLTTDENGEFKIENLEVGKYRLIQKDAPDGYIVDLTDTIEFTIDNENINYDFTPTIETLDFSKKILLDDKSYGDDVGAFKKDTNSWKITADIPSIINKMEEYKIEDKLQEGLIYKENSINVFGANDEIEEKLSNEYYTINLEDKSFSIDFNTKMLNKYKSIIIKYDTNFEETVSYGKFTNQANLIYTNFISEDGTSKSNYKISASASVHTGSVLIYKIDQDGNPLQGATFKIANSKENAKSGIFLTDVNGNEITATSNENGYIVFNGLKYDSSTEYWIVETQSPSYEEDGEIKYYNLLDNPVKVVVDNLSQNYNEEVTTVVVNKKGFKLPLTGGTVSIFLSLLGLCIISIIVIIKKRNKFEK